MIRRLFVCEEHLKLSKGYKALVEALNTSDHQIIMREIRSNTQE